MARQGKAPTGEDYRFTSRGNEGLGSEPYSKNLPDTETQEGGWTEVVKSKSARESEKGHGTQKLPSQRQNGFTNHNGPQQKPPSPPKGPLPQPLGEVGTGHGLPLNDMQGPGTTSNIQPRSWANIAASKPV